MKDIATIPSPTMTILFRPFNRSPFFDAVTSIELRCWFI